MVIFRSFLLVYQLTSRFSAGQPGEPRQKNHPLRRGQPEQRRQTPLHGTHWAEKWKGYKLNNPFVTL